MIEDSKQVYEFDEFRLDVMKRQLTREGEVVPLYSKAFDLLLAMVKNGGRDLTKDELLDSVWPGQMLEEANLTVNMSAVRKALGEKAAQPRYIVTIPGHGYRFIADVRDAREVPAGVIIQTETISQITIEQETDDASDEMAASSRSASPAAASIVSHTDARKLGGATVPAQRFFRRPSVLIALLLGASVLGLAAVFAVREVSRRGALATKFQHIKLRQLTNDGSVVTAAISPDGKFFVFVHAEKEKKSLRLGQINGDAPIELRSSADVVYRGVEFAADGSSVYYVLEEGGRETLYRISVLGGVPVKARDNLAPYFALAPDNKRIAFVRSDADNKTRSVVVSNLDGSNEKMALTLPINRALNSINLCWSPDSSTIALGATGENQTAEGIFLLRVSSGELRPLTTPVWREIARTAWLKDGSGVLAIASSNATQEYRQVWFAALTTGEVRRVTTDLNSYDIGLSTAADSKNALAVEHQQINNVWVAPTDDLSKSNQLTFGALNRSDGGAGLDWTPNGKIIYASGGAASRNIWVMDANGANAKQLTPFGAYDSIPSVTGDGRFMVFDSDRSGAGSEIWRANIDGTDLRQLTTCGRNSQPSVTPDGQWIVYKSTCDSSGGLWRVSIDGGQPTRLTEKAGSWPWVSPDGRSVACEYLGGTSGTKLAIIPIEGGPPAKEFDVPAQANFRYGVRWSTDGKSITYRDWGKGLWRQLLAGGAPERIQGLPDEKIYSYGWSRDGKLLAFTRGMEIRDVVLISSSN